MSSQQTNEADIFSLERFLSLAGSELVEYAEPFVNIHLGEIPQGVYLPLRLQLANMDEMSVP